jgi:hypothetical protein
MGVRFLPSGYVAPLRVAHDLSDRQRRILQAIAGGKESSIANIRTQINTSVADCTLQDDLLRLKRLGLIHSRGHCKGLCGSSPQRQSLRRALPWNAVHREESSYRPSRRGTGSAVLPSGVADCAVECIHSPGHLGVPHELRQARFYISCERTRELGGVKDEMPTSRGRSGCAENMVCSHRAF